MLKSKIFNFVAYKFDGYEDHNEKFEMHQDAHDKEISDFIEYLSKEGYALVSMDSVSFGRFEVNNRVRTTIIYIEHPTRKVLFEKIKINEDL